jgi:Restriction Endonuclease associating with ARP
MNIFCHPGVARNSEVSGVLAVEWNGPPQYGFRPRVPLLNETVDRTEVDMKVQDLLIEAKLTESDFQRAPKTGIARYRDFLEVFDAEQLRQNGHYYYSYQLIRSVLAAYASQCAFCVLLDARRPDLIDEWYDVMKCVKPIELRVRCKLLTWQELSRAVPSTLRQFLAGKYGI